MAHPRAYNAIYLKYRGEEQTMLLFLTCTPKPLKKWTRLYGTHCVCIWNKSLTQSLTHLALMNYSNDLCAMCNLYSFTPSQSYPKILILSTIWLNLRAPATFFLCGGGRKGKGDKTILNIFIHRVYHLIYRVFHEPC